MTQVARRRTGPSKGDLREAAILSSARQLFSRRAYDSITIDDLAKAAGISRTSFYFYFPTKTAVLTALMEQVWDELGAAHVWYDSDGPSPDLLRAQLTAIARLCRDNAGILACATTAGGTYEPLRDFMARAQTRANDRAAAKIRRDQQAGLATTTIHADRLAEMVSAIRNARFDQLAHATDTDIDEAVADLTEAIRRLVY